MSVVVRCEHCKRIVEENPTCYRCGGELYLVDASKKSDIAFCKNKECRKFCRPDDYKEIRCPDCKDSRLFFIPKDLTK